MRTMILALSLPFALVAVAGAQPPANVGYYRQPALRGDTVVFVSEGDLWKVGALGGQATRLTTHPGEEYSPQISPDGKLVAFCGEYEGVPELYVMPVEGGLPKRLTFEGATRIGARGWTSDGKVIYATDRYSTLPNTQLGVVDPLTGTRTLMPLAQAADGVVDGDGGVYFVRIPFNGSHTKRYKGGTIEQIWRWSGKDTDEAVNLTGDFEGTSRRPMAWNGRVYFASDRDGYMNLWSMGKDGKDVKQHTTLSSYDMYGTNMDAGRVVYQLGADLHLYDIAKAKDSTLNITLASDLDQTRERWINKPTDYVTSAHLSPDGDRVVLTARGQVFVVPAKQGRLVEATRKPGVRFRDARFSADGKSLVALSDQSGEVEAWRVPANGVGEPEQLTTGAEVLRWQAVPSPDGKHIAHTDKNQRLWVYSEDTKQSKLVEQSQIDQIETVEWSGDGRWLAYVAQADNMMLQIKLYSVENGTITAVTSDRFQSFSPAWSTDGQWLYFLSERHLATTVASPWGINQPDPFLDKTTKVYAVSLKPGPTTRWPFQAKDELFVDDKKKETKKDEPAKPETKPDTKPENGEKKDDQPADKGDAKPDAKKDAKKDEAKKVEITLDGIQLRQFEVPVANGRYSSLAATDKALFFLSRDLGDREPTLVSFPITSESPELKPVVEDIKGYELSQDRKKFLIHKGDGYSIIDANAGKGDLDKKGVDLSGWKLTIVPRDEYRQMYIESWRLLRDYFYDPAMHGVNWPAMRDKYMPLVDRVRSRVELSDVMIQLTGELSTLHHFVRDGDARKGTEMIGLASLGCVLTRDEGKGGYVIASIYASDPDEPGKTAPIARPLVGGKVGEVIKSIDGVATLSVPDINSLLRNKGGKQVLMTIAGDAGPREAVVVPISLGVESDLRYHDWEYSRRKMTDELSKGKIGYLHLRAMGQDNYEEFAKGYFPVFNRDGLIIDVRNNRGGNIDSWILGKLMKKAWMTWSQRVGQAPNWNMQYAFRGHMVLLCNERTSSDGEAIADGFRRLGLGTVIGTRTWGGEVWLSSSNVLVDKGIATAAEMGVWGAEGTWLIEGRGVEPDITVDNPPHATFKGEDAQLRAAVEFLEKKIAEKPVLPVKRPVFPDKSFKNK